MGKHGEHLSREEKIARIKEEALFIHSEIDEMTSPKAQNHQKALNYENIDGSCDNIKTLLSFFENEIDWDKAMESGY